MFMQTSSLAWRNFGAPILFVSYFTHFATSHDVRDYFATRPTVRELRYYPSLQWLLLKSSIDHS